MAEFRVMIDYFKETNTQYKNNFQELLNQESKCMNSINEIKKQINDENDFLHMANKCQQRRKEFENYFDLYSRDFVQKGNHICYQATTEVLLQQEQQGVVKKVKKEKIFSNEVQDSKLGCMKFYAKKLLIFSDNVNKKLRDLNNDDSYDYL